VLRAEVERLQNEVKEMTMMQYISRALKSSMEDLGYNIIGHEEVKTVNRSIDKNYYDFTSDSAINVATSKNGAVLFEVMGKGSDIDGRKKESIRHDMEKFCPDYNKVKTELSKYGITLERENLYPPDVKYVRGTDVATVSHDRRRSNKKQLGMMQSE
jgi:hypothetical protein